MPKVFVALDDNEQAELERICKLNDGRLALYFLKERVAPKVRKRTTCGGRAAYSGFYPR